MTKDDPIVERVRALLLERSQKGLQCYGIGLDRTDLTMAEWLAHLQDELLDGANYIEALKIHAVDSMAILRSENANLRSELARSQAENIRLKAEHAPLKNGTYWYIGVTRPCVKCSIGVVTMTAENQLRICPACCGT